MTFQYASDLHLEFPKNRQYIKDNPIIPKAETLLLAGDITNFVSINEHLDFFSYLSDNFKMVYWVPGNHEAYGLNTESKLWYDTKLIKNNIIVADRFNCIIEGVKIIMTTLWTHINPVNALYIQKEMSDFSQIKAGKKYLNAEIYNKWHKISLNYLRKHLATEDNLPIVVMTHHVPTLLNYPKEYKQSRLNGAFAVELFDFITELQPDYWVYGHSHRNTPVFNIGKTTLVTNQLGYVELNESRSYKDSATFTINV